VKQHFLHIDCSLGELALYISI